MKVKMLIILHIFSYMLKPNRKLVIFHPKNTKIWKQGKHLFLTIWEGEGNQLVKLSQKKL
jgi:hypothetical protein